MSKYTCSELELSSNLSESNLFPLSRVDDNANEDVVNDFFGCNLVSIQRNRNNNKKKRREIINKDCI